MQWMHWVPSREHVMGSNAGVAQCYLLNYNVSRGGAAMPCWLVGPSRLVFGPRKPLGYHEQSERRVSKNKIMQILAAKNIWEWQWTTSFLDEEKIDSKHNISKINYCQPVVMIVFKSLENISRTSALYHCSEPFFEKRKKKNRKETNCDIARAKNSVHKSWTASLIFWIAWVTKTDMDCSRLNCAEVTLVHRKREL